MHTNPDEFERQSVPGEGPRPVKRARASRPKVKSGCITCKARRVKCDETKPQCLRCQKFGRICDGYAQETPSRGSMMPIQPRIPTADFYTPSISVEATEEEGRYFRYFCDRTAYQLPGYFDPSFWNHIILQESHNVTPIRHAVIAIGALNKAIGEAPGPNLKVNVIQDIHKKHYEFAVLQHLKAIQALNQYISSSNGPQLRTALMACLLFVCFETIQGSYASSVQQTYGGLKLLRSYYAGKPGSKPWIPRRISAGFNSKPQTDKVMAKVHSRPGMDSSSKSATISSHIEEYLETEKPSPQSTHTPIIDRTPTPPQRDYSPHLDEMTIPSHYKSNLTLEQQRSLSGTPTQDYPSAYHTPSEYVWPKEHQSSNIAMPITIINKGPSSNHSTSTICTPASAHTPPSMGNTPPPTTYRSSQSPPILTNTRKRPLQSRSPTPPILQNDFTLEESIIQAFVRLDGQGLFFGMSPGIPPLLWDIHSAHHIPIPKVFSSFSEAQHCWDFLMDRTLQFYRRTLFDRKYASEKSDTPSEIAQQYATYVAGLDEFEQAFQPILNSSISPEGKVLNQAAIVVITHLKATAITLSAVTSTSEMVYDSFMDAFRYITRAAEKLITTSEANPSVINTSRFSFDIGIVPPLHVVATKCREPSIRRKAVDLLFRSPRQEGMWDGVLSARIGRWIISCEEDGLDVPVRLVIPDGQPNYHNQRFQYRESPQQYDELLSPGYWNNGEIFSDGDIFQESFTPYLSQSQSPVPRTPSPYTQARTPPMREKISVPRQEKVWVVPEDKRIQLVVVDFHIPDRYIMVKCKRSVPSKDGTREERETIIAW
ncbi:tRNA A64-2'-O-ribosylphosphate transferase [Ciborinia camelliae]|nr:tRNA A64-2'-O-ribosylphosphate transferase [Ciborinia camelliae]